MTFNAYMHERNIYKNPPDFIKLASDYPEFSKYIIPDAKGQKGRVDFSNTAALRMLTKILLKKDFNLDLEIPEGFLIPTVPQRLNYILWLEDLLSNILENEREKKNVSGIDIGTGACAIFSVLGAQKNGWKFIATESSDDAITWAKKNIEKNHLHEHITVVKVNEGSSLDKVLSSNEDCFDFCMCNPPFFQSSEEIRMKHPNSNETIADVAQNNEIFVTGGELDFVRNILKDSLVYKNRIHLFTSMFGKKKSFLEILKDLKEVPGVKFTSTEFCQGNTMRWGVAWTFDQSFQFEKEVKKRMKPKKAKPALEYQIFVKSKKFQLDTTVKQAKVHLRSLEIPFTVVRSSQNFTELLLKSDKNTWTHQRRKRRELQRHKKEDEDASEAIATVPPNENVKVLTKEAEKESSEKIINLKNEDTLKVVHLSTKTDTVTKVCNTNIHDTTTCPELESQSDISLPNLSKSECSKDSLPNNKRKLDFDSEESCSHKKTKLDNAEKTETFPSEQNILFEDRDDKSSVLNLKDEKISTCDAVTHPVLAHEQHSLNSLNDTNIISPSKSDTYSLSDAESESKGDKIKETEDICSDLKTENIEPEGLVLYCYLQFIKGKNKVYVKMNCPPSADRNTMYQVFQLIKNKVNSF